MTHQRPNQFIRLFLLGLTLIQPSLPVLAATPPIPKAPATQPASGDAQNSAVRPTTFEVPSATEDAQLIQKVPLRTKEDPLKAMNRTADSVDSMITGLRKLELSGIDKTMLDADRALAEQLALNPDAKNEELQAALPPDLNLSSVGKFDSRVPQSLEHLLDEYEFLDVEAILKGHRTKAGKVEQESPTPEGERPKQSPHYRGQAVDISAIDYLRGTQFTIKTDAGGKETVEEKPKHLPLDPIKVAWQEPVRAGTGGAGQPRINGQTPGSVGGAGLLDGLLNGLLQGFDAAGADVDLNLIGQHLGSVDNIGELAAQTGAGYLPQALEGDDCLTTGPFALRVTGQCAVAGRIENQIPAFGLFGENFDEFLYHAGREVVTANLGLAPGALLGRTSADVISNAGERFFESQLGDLPLGSLDGVVAGDRADLERRVGRGRVAKLLKLEVGSLPLGASPSDFQTALGLVWSDIEANGQLLSNQLGIPSVDSVGLIRTNPDQWLQTIGADTLGRLEAYHSEQRDAALNLEARPTIIELPAGSAPQIIDELVRKYQFRPAARQLLDQIRAAEALPTAANTNTRYRAIFPTDTDLRAWLLVHAYHVTSDPNASGLVNRFLAADAQVFADVGREVLAKGLAVDNDQRAALRQYLRDGTIDQAFLPTIDWLAGQVGFPSRDAFEAVFVNDAPAVGFTHVGRLRVATVFAATTDSTPTLLARPTHLPIDIRDRLETLRRELAQLRSDATIQDFLNAGLVAVDDLTGQLDEQGIPLRSATPSAWQVQLRAIHQAGQAAITSNRTGFEDSRGLLLAINRLSAQGGEEAFEIRSVNLSIPGVPMAPKLLAASLVDHGSMTDAVEAIGGALYDASLGLEPGTLAPLNAQVATAVRSGNPQAAQTQVTRAAGVYRQPLGEAAAVLRRTINQFGAPLDLNPERLLRSVFTGWQLETDVGSRILDAGFGLSRTKPLAELLRTVPFNGAATSPFYESIGLRQLARVVTGLGDLDVDPDEVGGAFQAMLYSTVSARTGWQIGPEGVRIGNPRQFIESITGKSLTREQATLLGIVDTSPKGLENFAKGWKFWEDPKLTPRLERIVRSSFPELGVVPPGILTTLFDPKIAGADRTKQLETLARSQLESRLVDPYLNSLLDIPGLPAGALLAAKSILLSDAPEAEKSKAWTALGLTTADSFTQAHFGFPVSWLIDDATGTKEKAQIGLRIASQQLGLDPAISGLVDTAFQTFFIDGGINTDTTAGRTQLAGLVQAVGSAAGVPAEYAAVASAFVTGDVQATALAFAGGQFDRALREAGIFTVGFADFYGAFTGPSQATLDQFRAEAGAEVLAKFGADPDPRVGNRDAFFDELMGKKIGEYQTGKQDNLMFAGLDLALSKATGLRGASGLAKAFLRGSFTDQAGAVGSLISAVTGSPEAAAILGNAQLVGDLRKFADSGNLDDLSDGSLASLDGWLQYGAGVPIPPGTSKAILGFTKTGDVGSFEILVRPETLLAFGGGYIDQAVGLPAGATAALYNGYQAIESAQTAFDLARANDFINNAGIDPELLGLSADSQKALTDLNLAQAGLVSTGVSLVFGKSIAGLDQSLGLPSGTAQMFVNGAIMAIMVPGIGLGALLMNTVVPWAIPQLLGATGLGKLLGPLGGLLGGGPKNRTVTLWSRYRELWPEEVEFNCREETKGEVTETKCDVGQEIALAKPAQLPEGVFFGPPPEQFAQGYEEGKRLAANHKLEQLVRSLLIMPLPQGTGDKNLTPFQIRSHSAAHGDQETLMDQVWGDKRTVGSYLETLTGPFKQRKGFSFDPPGKLKYYLDKLHYNF